MIFRFRFSGRIARLLVALGFPSVLGAASELGRPFLENFPPSLYNRSAPTYGIAQDDAGLIYIGCFSVTLLYDGAVWSDIEMPFARFVHAVTRAPDGTLYAGAFNQLGYFKNGRGAKKEFVSLLEHLPKEERDFREVLAIGATADSVCFAAARKLFLWRDGAFTVIEHGSTHVFAPGGTVYTHAEGGPLRRLEGDKLVTVSADPALTAHPLTFLLAGPEGALLAGTANHGLFLVRDGRATPWATELDARFRTDRPTHGLHLADGTLVVSFETSGIAFLSREGRLLTLLNEANGLENNNVHDLFTDREGGIWITHNNGVSRVEPPTALSFFDRSNGLDHAGYSLNLARHAGVLFCSTLNGIFRLEPAAAPRAPTMVRIAGTTPSTRAIFSSADGLFTCDERSLLRYDGAGFVPVLTFSTRSSAPPYFLVPHRRDPTRLWMGQIEGLRVLRRSAAGWTDEGLVPGVAKTITDARELPDGTLWLTKNFDGFMRVRFPAGGPPQVENFPGGRGLPAKLAGNNNVVLRENEPLFAIDYGLFRFNDARGEFVPFEDFGPEINRNPYKIGRLYPSGPDRFWLFAATTPPGPDERRGRRIFSVPRSGPWTQLPQMAAQLTIMPTRRGLLEEEIDGRRVLWTSGSGALARFDVALAAQPPVSFAAFVHAEAAEAGQRWSSERTPVDVTDPRPDAVVPPPVGGEPMPVPDRARLSHRQSAVKFEFFAPRHRHSATPRYQTRLEGYERDWTAWTAERTRSFTNLPAGEYAFHVRANDASGTLSAPAVLRFHVLPPWSQTWWMLGVYSLAGLGGLFAAFHWRLGAVRRRNQKLETLVAERTADLSASEAQLRLTRDAAEAANRAKSVFLANMSHELRTPLNAVLGYAQLLRRAPHTSPETGRQLEIIHQSGEHLLHMINEVLDLAKVEAGKVELRPAPMSLPRLAAHLAEVFSLRAGQKGLAFTMHAAGDLPETVLADEPRLRQVLYNLLGNAVKFTERGSIELTIERAPATGAVRFRISDTGVGIPPHEQSAIFGPFHQAAPPTLAAQGAGLGLAISQRLVRLMGGEIAVTSAPGAGSSFEFAVPLPSAYRHENLNTAATRWPAGYTGTRRRVLIVDDEAVNRALLRSLLAPLGFELLEADDGTTALAVLERERIDLVLMDLRLKQQDGLAATREIRARRRAVKIIAVSASVFPDDRAQALGAGCDEFVAKPIDAGKLLEAVGAQLALEWTWRSSDSHHGLGLATLPADLSPDWALPPHDVLTRLEALADLGDLPTLREELTRTRLAHPTAGSFVDGLGTLAAHALLPRLRAWLAAALRNAS